MNAQSVVLFRDAVLDRNVAGNLKADAVARIVSHAAVADRHVLALEQIDATTPAAIQRLRLVAIAIDGQALYGCVLDVPPADDRERQSCSGLPRNQIVQVQRRRELEDIGSDLASQGSGGDFKASASRAILDRDAVANAEAGGVR